MLEELPEDLITHTLHDCHLMRYMLHETQVTVSHALGNSGCVSNMMNVLS